MKTKNDLNIFELFKGCPNTRLAFFRWCKNSSEFSEDDIEHLENHFLFPTLGSFRTYQNDLLDFLEENNYYVGTPLRSNFKYVTVVHKKEDNYVNNSTLIFSNSGFIDRLKSSYRGVEKSLENLEKEL